MKRQGLHLLTDFEMVPLSRQSAAAYESIPKRKDGNIDRRYRAAKKWAAYVHEQNRRSGKIYVSGRKMRKAGEFRL